MKAKEAYEAYLLAASKAFKNEDVDKYVEKLSDEQKKLFDSAYARYEEDAKNGWKCPIIELPYDTWDDEDDEPNIYSDHFNDDVKNGLAEKKERL